MLRNIFDEMNQDNLHVNSMLIFRSAYIDGAAATTVCSLDGITQRWVKAFSYSSSFGIFCKSFCSSSVKFSCSFYDYTFNVMSNIFHSLRCLYFSSEFSDMSLMQRFCAFWLEGVQSEECWRLVLVRQMALHCYVVVNSVYLLSLLGFGFRLFF